MHVDFADSGVPDADRRAYWQAMDVESDILEVVVDMDLRYDGRVWVSERMRHHAGIINLLETVYLSIFRFRKFTTSRWLNVSSSLRTLMLSLDIGLAEICEQIRKHNEESSFYLHNFFNNCEEIRIAKYAKILLLPS